MEELAAGAAPVPDDPTEDVAVLATLACLSDAAAELAEVVDERDNLSKTDGDSTEFEEPTRPSTGTEGKLEDNGDVD